MKGSSLSPDPGSFFFCYGVETRLEVPMRQTALLVLLMACDPGQDKASPAGDGSDSGCEQTVLYLDNDGDGYGDPATSATTCAASPGYVPDGTDCDDHDAAVHPDNTDTCDGIDEDCDGLIDEDSAWITAWPDADGDGQGDATAEPLSTCDLPDGSVMEGSDCDDTAADVYTGATETCDDRDEDCDGLIDEDLPVSTVYADGDGDGTGDRSASLEVCDLPAGYVHEAGDCDDTDAAIHPGATDDCDGVDTDCDDEVDEDATWVVVYDDADGDGYGDPSLDVETCEPDPGVATVAGDCDDGDATVNPGATEVCNTVDDDCDGLTDAADPSAVITTTYYVDKDKDGYGDPGVPSAPSCSRPSGYVTDDTDCDDTDDDVHPGATDACDSDDDDCDGSVDEDATFTDWYRDADNDRFGDPAVSTSACKASSGYVSNDGDCDDTSNKISPADDEICNAVDDDCDGLVDDDDDSLDPDDGYASYTDADGDGYGDPDAVVVSCDPTVPSGSVDNDDDLDDADAGGGYAVDLDALDVALDATSDSIYASGRFLAVLDDIDGDGLDEVLTGGEGRFYCSGLESGWMIGWGYLWQNPGGAAPDLRLVAESADDVLGFGGVALDDLDGDGLDDVALAAPYYIEVYSWCSTGCYPEPRGIRLFASDASSEFSELAEIGEDALGADVYAGFLLAAVDDQDGDGLRDLVSMDASSVDIRHDSLYTGVVTLDLTSPGEAVAGNTSAILIESWTASDIPVALREVADMDGDGIDEVATIFDETVYVIPANAASGAVVDEATLALTPSVGEPLGLADLGDMDGDGLADLAFADPDWSSAGIEVGAAFVLPGGSSGALDESGLAVIEGASADAPLGEILAGPGDLDADGELDLVVAGDRGEDLGAYVWLGPFSGTRTTDDATRFVTADSPVLSFPDRPIDANGDGIDDLMLASGDEGNKGTVVVDGYYYYAVTGYDTLLGIQFGE